MPEIKELNPTAELVLNLATKIVDPPNIRLTVRPLSFLKAIDIMNTEKKAPEYSRVLVEEVLDCVVGWDLMKAGEPIPVTEVTKGAYLAPLLREAVLDEKGTVKNLLIFEIRDFAGATENFLKN